MTLVRGTRATFIDILTMIDLSTRGRLAFEAFALRHRIPGPGVFPYAERNEAVLGAWREYIMATAHPNNQALAAIANRLWPDDGPLCVRDFIAYVDAYDALIVKWLAGDFTNNTTNLNFPQDLDGYLRRLVIDLREEV